MPATYYPNTDVSPDYQCSANHTATQDHSHEGALPVVAVLGSAGCAGIYYAGLYIFRFYTTVKSIVENTRNFINVMDDKLQKANVAIEKFLPGDPDSAIQQKGQLLLSLRIKPEDAPEILRTLLNR